MFEPFPKLTRFTHDWTITEKIDGSNAQVMIVPVEQMATEEIDEKNLASFDVYQGTNDFYVFAGSRNRWLTADKSGDHMGFAKFVAERAPELISTLGEGRHFGEWYGNGIQRGYGLSEKRFALFNSTRWTGADLPDRVDVVPVLFNGFLADSAQFDIELTKLQQLGSRIAPNFMTPEGIVMYHGPSKTAFKRTFEYDEAGKWAENQERKA